MIGDRGRPVSPNPRSSGPPSMLFWPGTNHRAGWKTHFARRPAPYRNWSCRRETSGPGVAEVVLDTDVLVDHLQGTRTLDAEFTGSCYSSITRAELYGGKGADERVIDRLLGQFEEISVDQRVAEDAGRIRRITGIRLPDALIAATAILVKCPLFTRNIRDFRRVRRLALYRPSR